MARCVENTVLRRRPDLPAHHWAGLHQHVAVRKQGCRSVRRTVLLTRDTREIHVRVVRPRSAADRVYGILPGRITGEVNDRSIRPRYRGSDFLGVAVTPGV